MFTAGTLRDVAEFGLLALILIRQERLHVNTQNQLDQISAQADTLIADETAEKTAIAEILSELNALRNAGQPIDPAQLDNILAKLTSVHDGMAQDTSDLVGDEQPVSPPVVPVVPAPVSTTPVDTTGASTAPADAPTSDASNTTGPPSTT